MNEYSSYRDVKGLWPTQIPAHWGSIQLSALFYEHKRKNTGGVCKNLLSLSYGHIVKKDINDGKGLKPNSYDTYNIISPNDIVLRLTDLQNDHKSLRTAISTEEGIVTSAYTTLRMRSALNNPRFLQLYLHAFDCHKCFYTMGAGIRQSLSYDGITNIMFPIPPRPEQDQIVRYLDWKTSEIAKFVNEKKKEIKRLTELKNAIISDAMTKGLHEDVPMRNTGIEWLPQIPAHWKIYPLRRFLRTVSKKNCPDLPLLSVVREKGVILRDVDDRTTNHNYVPEDLSGYKVVTEGQFVINKMKAWQGSYGVSQYDGIVSPAYYVFDLDASNKEFFHFAIRSKVYVNFFAQNSGGIRVGQWDLSLEKMKNIPFFLPPEEEQEEILKIIPTKIKEIDSLILGIQQEITLVEELRTKIISDTVTGKVDVRGVEVPDFVMEAEDVDDEGTDADDESEEMEGNE